MPLLPPHAAGIDGGAAAPWGGVPADRDAQPLQPCRACPGDVPRLADWCTACRVTTVAMASTGVDWLPLVQRREARGCAVALVQARHVQHGPGRPTTERCDGRWLPRVPSDGVCAAACRPSADRCPLRSVLRHRDHLIRMTGQPMQHRHKALDHRHLPLHHGRRAVSGVTGRRMLRAMVAGERAPKRCATSRDARLPSRQDTRAQALEGEDRAAQRVPLTPSRALEDVPQPPIAAGAQDIARVLDPWASLGAPAPHPVPPPTTPPRQPQRHAPACALRTPLSRITGVDRTHGPG